MTSSFWPCYGPGVELPSNRNEYQRYLLGGEGDQCIGLTTLSPLYADFLEILGASKSWSLKRMSTPVEGLRYLALPHSNFVSNVPCW